MAGTTSNGTSKSAGRKMVGRMVIAFLIVFIIASILWTFSAGIRAKGEAMVSK